MKCFKYILFTISFLISIIISFIIQEFYNFNIINYINNNRRRLSDSIEQTDSETPYEKAQELKKFFKKLEKKFTEQTFDGEVNYTNYTELYKNYIINITNNTNINSSTINKTGLMTMRILLPYEIKAKNDEEYPIFKIRIIENKKIDKWLFLSIVNKNDKKNIQKNITLNSYNESFLNISYNSKIEKGNYFNFPYTREYCNIQYNLNLIQNLIDIKEKNSTKKHKEIIGIEGNLLSQDCDFKMEFYLKKHLISNQQLYGKIVIYCMISSIISLLHLINNKLLISKIDNSMVNCNSICIFTICQDIIWNCYCCYSNFYLLLNYKEFKFYFLIACFLYFINFGFVEFPLLYQLLCIKYSHIINDVFVFRKKIIQFCILFYITILFTFIFVMKCFYSPPFILFSFIFVWMPQIVFNIQNKNRVSFPIIYIISMILNRAFPSFYFNLYEDNFLRIPNNKNIELNYLCILLLSTLVLYSQTLFGPSWFLPMLQVDEYDFYIDEKDLKIIKNDIYNLECLICLNPIIPNSSNINKDEDNNNNMNNIDNNKNNCDNNNFNETDSLVIEVNDNSVNNFKNNNFGNNVYVSCCKFKNRNKYVGNKSIFLNFHEFSKNIFDKPYMITPCNHIFHSDCLEEWFKMKKECPNCRTEITQDMYN